MPRLIAAIMRHGAYFQPPGVPSAHLPHPLTDEGAQQARDGAGALSEMLLVEGWKLDPVIDSSSLLRAWQTAEIAADIVAAASGQRATVESFDSLAERSVGSAANLSEQIIEDIVARDPRHAALPPGWKSDSAFKLPFIGAESLLEAGERVARHLKDRINRLESTVGHTVVKLFVGHGGAFRHAAAALGVMTVAQARARSMYYGGVVFLEAPPEGAWRHIAGEWKSRRTANDRPD